MSQSVVQRTDPTPGAPITRSLIDIFAITAISAIVYAIESYAIDRSNLPFGNASQGAITVMVGAACAIALTLFRGGTFADLGFKRPRNWVHVPWQVAVILVVFFGTQSLAPIAVSFFFDLPQADLSQYDSLNGNLSAALTLALILPITASIPEEIIYRGFLMNRLGHVFGVDITGTAITVVIQALIFGSIHYQWGTGGMIVTFIMGLVWGLAYVLCDRNLWVVILAHSGGHLIFISLIYSGLPVFA